MENTNRLLTKLIWLIAALLTLRVAVWFFEQRAHDKEYWLIFAHVVRRLYWLWVFVIRPL